VAFVIARRDLSRQSNPTQSLRGGTSRRGNLFFFLSLRITPWRDEAISRISRDCFGILKLPRKDQAFIIVISNVA